MAVTASKILPRIKRDLRITSQADNPRLLELIAEAVESLQQFKSATLVDPPAEGDTLADGEAVLSALDLRYVAIYCAIYFDGQEDLRPALSHVTEQVRSDGGES